jgi:8-oxo-dGTP diphosphatase
VLAGVQRVLLLVWRRVPRLVRRWIVRLAAPSFTVGAACVIERDDGALLLVRLVYRDGWGLPGGLIKRSETVADCARREVTEEVGLDVELTSEPAVVVDTRPQRVDVVFRARPAPGCDPKTAAPRSVEIREVRWFPVDGLPDLQHETVSALAALAASVRGSAGPVGGASTGVDATGLQRAAVAATARRSASRPHL